MSEKITFQELIDSMAEESDKSREFTHDFIKDFVSVINDELEQNKSVHIAGFGKFELRQIDEREGINPQTGKPLTIPAHDKAVFKPYKELRELVNAPYRHLEPEPIEEETEEPSGEKEISSEKNHTDEHIQPFIPTAPPPSIETPDDKDKSSSVTDRDEKQGDDDEVEKTKPSSPESGMGKKEEERKSSSFQFEDFSEENIEEEPEKSDADEEEASDSDIDSDIVEFVPGSATEEDPSLEDEDGDGNGDGDDTNIEDNIGEDPFIFDMDMDKEIEKPEESRTSEKESETVPENNDKEEIQESSEEVDPFTFNSNLDLDQPSEETESESDEKPDKKKDIEESEKPDTPLVFKDRRHRHKKGDKTFKNRRFWIILTVLVLVLIGGGAWYFMNYNTQKTVDQSSTSSPAANAEKQQGAGSRTDDDQTDAQTSADDQKTTKNAKQSATTEPDTPNTTNHTVEKGETLWSIADLNYQDPYLWPWIYDENLASINNPDLIIAGQNLKIPQPGGTGGTLAGNDSLQVAIAFVETYSWYKEKGLEEAKYYLYVAKQYHDEVLKHTNKKIDSEDLKFANQE